MTHDDDRQQMEFLSDPDRVARQIQAENRVCAAIAAVVFVVLLVWVW